MRSLDEIKLIDKSRTNLMITEYNGIFMKKYEYLKFCICRHENENPKYCSHNPPQTEHSVFKYVLKVGTICKDCSENLQIHKETQKTNNKQKSCTDHEKQLMTRNLELDSLPRLQVVNLLITTHGIQQHHQ